MVDEVWQLSKDSADTATANTQTQAKSRTVIFMRLQEAALGNTRKVFYINFCVQRVVREKSKSRINTVTELLLMLDKDDFICGVDRENSVIVGMSIAHPQNDGHSLYRKRPLGEKRFCHADDR